MMTLYYESGVQGASKMSSRAPEPPPKIGYGDHLLRERRGLTVDAQDLTMVQRKELRQNITTAILGVVRSGLCVQGGATRVL